MTPSTLDRLITWLSPARGAARLVARARIEGLTRAVATYDGAARTHRTQGRWVTGGSANREIRPALVRLRDVSRDHGRNNAYAARAVATIVSNTVGEGIIPTIEAKSSRFEAAVQGLVNSHLRTPAIDFDGRHNLSGLQALVMRTVVEAGECLVLRQRTSSAMRLPLAFQIRVLEPEFLDWTKDGPLPDGAFRVQGVEFDKYGRRVAYWLYKEHPGDTRFLLTISSVRVPAEDVLHIYRVDRPGQARGVPWGSPAFMTLTDLQEYEEAELVRQKIAACFAVFFTDEGGQTKLADAAATAAADKSADGRPIDMLEPGLIQRLPPATDVKFATPPLTTGYPDYVRAQLRRVAVGYGVPYETLAGDLSQVNFSSGRMGWLEFQRSVDQWRWHMLIPHLCEPIGRWFREAAMPALNMRSDFSLSWTPPRREMIDPAKEIGAARDAIRAGLSSRSEELRKLGYDPDMVEADLAAENARGDALGLKFDSDGRFPMNAPAPGAAAPTLKTDARSDNVAD